MAHLPVWTQGSFDVKKVGGASVEAGSVQGSPEGSRFLRVAHIRHYASLVVPGHGLLVTRLTGYLTGLLEGVRKVTSGTGDVNPTTTVDLPSRGR